MQSTERDPLKRAAKVGSTKSRSGCTTCRQRRVRCDEARPACANCVRLGLECIYSTEQQRSSKSQFRAYEPDVARPRNSVPLQTGLNAAQAEPPFDDVPESTERRLLELRLLHNWTTVVSRPFQNTPAPRWGELWRIDLPLIAFNSSGVLSALMAMSATHLLRKMTESTEIHMLRHARDRYFSVALAQQRIIVRDLKPANVDEASFTALLISLTAFSMLLERPLEPYSPPTDWLEMGYGAGVVMRQAAELLDETSSAKTREIIETTMPIHQNFEPQSLDEATLEPYEALLRRVRSTQYEAMGDEEEREACILAIAVIASLRRAIQAGEPEYVHLRRITMFPFMVPARFIDLVREERPIALVILAHFFAAVDSTEALAYLGNTANNTSVGRREVSAIQRHVPENWQGLLIWPMDEMRASR